MKKVWSKSKKDEKSVSTKCIVNQKYIFFIKIVDQLDILTNDEDLSNDPNKVAG